MVDPNAWLGDFEARVAAAREKAAKFQESLGSAGASASSKDGLITVSVAPNGSLADLKISDVALHGSGTRLAAEIMRTAREAQRRAAGNVLTAFTELGGPDSEATKMLTGFVPPPEPAEPPAGQHRFVPPEQPTAPAGNARFQPPVTRWEPPGPQPRRTARPADEDSSGGDSVLGSTDW